VGTNDNQYVDKPIELTDREDCMCALMRRVNVLEAGLPVFGQAKGILSVSSLVDIDCKGGYGSSPQSGYSIWALGVVGASGPYQFYTTLHSLFCFNNGQFSDVVTDIGGRFTSYSEIHEGNIPTGPQITDPFTAKFARGAGSYGWVLASEDGPLYLFPNLNPWESGGGAYDEWSLVEFEIDKVYDLESAPGGSVYLFTEDEIIEVNDSGDIINRTSVLGNRSAGIHYSTSRIFVFQRGSNTIHEYDYNTWQLEESYLMGSVMDEAYILPSKNAVFVKNEGSIRAVYYNWTEKRLYQMISTRTQSPSGASGNLVFTIDPTEFIGAKTYVLITGGILTRWYAYNNDSKEEIGSYPNNVSLANAFGGVGAKFGVPNLLELRCAIHRLVNSATFCDPVTKKIYRWPYGHFDLNGGRYGMGLIKEGQQESETNLYYQSMIDGENKRISKYGAEDSEYKWTWTRSPKELTGDIDLHPVWTDEFRWYPLDLGYSWRDPEHLLRAPTI